MAFRQRFIHPSIWKDPVFGRMTAEEQIVFIGLFSIADDDGRTNADPAYLRSELFAYKEHTIEEVQALRDSVVEKVPSVHLYHARGVDLIALLKWKEYQKPKYPKPSKLPAPFLPDDDGEGLGNPSPKHGESLGEASPETAQRVGLGREGLGKGGVGLGKGEGRAWGDDGADGASLEKPPGFQIPKLREIA